MADNTDNAEKPRVPDWFSNDRAQPQPAVNYVHVPQTSDWTWRTETWTPCYNQAQFNCNNWVPASYPQQNVSGVVVKPEAPRVAQPPDPKVGANLLTELRMAELKRLIDRDSAEFKEASAMVSIIRAASVETETPKTVEREVEKEETRVEPREAAVEQCLKVILDYEPENRSYGEMPVTVGEEIWVDAEPLSEWIYGKKRSSPPEEGWLPAFALGIIYDSGFKGESNCESQDSAVGSKGGRRPQTQDAHNSQHEGQKKLSGRYRQEHADVRSTLTQIPSGARGNLPRCAGRVHENRGQAGSEKTNSQDRRVVAADSGARRERGARARPSLNAMMDRLNKPLVVQ